MYKNHHITVIIPAYNEEDSIGLVVDGLPKDVVSRVIVVDNASTDRTKETALRHGALAVTEPEPGYGSACLKGISTVDKTDIVVFIDGDYSDYPEGIVELVDPIIEKGYDFVISSRQSKKVEKGSMTLPQRWGTLLAVRLVEMLYDYRYSDMGPFRAIRHDKLLELGMTDRTYGWTIEMQIKALQHGLKIKEVPLPYRKRIGTSKISGTIKGVINAGCKIIWTIFKMRFFLCRK